MSKMKNNPVIIIQDGAVDELMSVALVGTMRNVDLLGIAVVNADCLATPTVEVTNKILDLMSITDVPVTESRARAVNAFPWTYRQYCLMANLLPMLNINKSRAKKPKMDAEEMIIDLILKNMEAGNPKVRLLILSPLTPIVTAWEKEPKIKKGIKEILWMGGALKPADGNCGLPYGNVDPGLAPGANANAEWNAYWDPYAVRDILASKVPLTMFPLNATNLVMLSPEIVLKFAPKSDQYPLYALAGQLYSMVAFEAGYAFWDTVTTAYLDKPEYYTVRRKRLLNIVSGPDQGNIIEDKNGHLVNVVTKIDVQKFYSYIFRKWRQL